MRYGKDSKEVRRSVQDQDRRADCQRSKRDRRALSGAAALTLGRGSVGSPLQRRDARSGFFKTLKAEEVYLTEYESYDEVRRRLPEFIEAVYNRKRLHSGISYWSPDEFETLWKKGLLSKLGIQQDSTPLFSNNWECA